MKKTYLIAAMMVGVLTLWMLSGLFKNQSQPDGAPLPQGADVQTRSDAPEARTRVRTRQLQAEAQQIEIALRGRTEAKRIVDIKAETSGRVTAVRAEKGQRVQAGDVLCELAEDDRRVKLAQAQAAFEKASIDYDGALRLKKENLLATTAIAASKSALESARAALKAAELEVQHLQMRAAFTGFIEERPAQIGALLERGAVCARLIDESTMLVSAQASERDVQRLKLDNAAHVQLLGGGAFDGKISFLAQAADAQTRTYRVEATLQTDGQQLRDGITAYISIPLQTVQAHRISPAVLALDNAGRVGVRTVNAERKVEFHHVEVVRETSSGVWITGLPDRVELITVGQEYVGTGDIVQTAPEDEASLSSASTH